jgi:ribosome biogenesis SPOUT family RNA methylase Rps3
MSTTDGLYTAVQRRTINQILKLATSDDKAKIIKAFNLAEKLTPEDHKSEILFVRDKIIDDHPALNIARHVVGQLSPRSRDRFIECFVINTMLRGSAKRTAFR